MPLGITIVQLLYSKIKLFLPDSATAVTKPGRADFGCILLPEISRPCGDPTESSKSRVCYSSSVAGGIGTVDGAARGCDALTMHGPSHASSRRLVRRTPFDSVDAVL